MLNKGTSIVVAYRLYFLDGRGHIVRVVELDCDCDDDALKEAQRHATGEQMELWERARKVRTFAIGSANSNHP